MCLVDMMHVDYRWLLGGFLSDVPCPRCLALVMMHVMHNGISNLPSDSRKLSVVSKHMLPNVFKRHNASVQCHRNEHVSAILRSYQICEIDRKSEYNKVKQAGCLLNRIKSQYTTHIFQQCMYNLCSNQSFA